VSIPRAQSIRTWYVLGFKKLAATERPQIRRNVLGGEMFLSPGKPEPRRKNPWNVAPAM
jgi:hypothetical protein